MQAKSSASPASIRACRTARGTSVITIGAKIRVENDRRFHVRAPPIAFAKRRPGVTTVDLLRRTKALWEMGDF